MGYILAIYCCRDDFVCVVCIFIGREKFFDFVMYVSVVVLGDFDR